MIEYNDSSERHTLTGENNGIFMQNGGRKQVGKHFTRIGIMKIKIFSAFNKNGMPNYLVCGKCGVSENAKSSVVILNHADEYSDELCADCFALSYPEVFDSLTESQKRQIKS